MKYSSDCRKYVSYWSSTANFRKMAGRYTSKSNEAANDETWAKKAVIKLMYRSAPAGFRPNEAQREFQVFGLQLENFIASEEVVL